MESETRRTKTTGSSAVTGDRRTIVFWSEAPGGYGCALPALIAGFERATPEIGVEAMFFDTYEEYLAAMAARQDGEPDVFSVEPGGPLAKLAAERRLLALDSYLAIGGWRDVFHPDAFRSLSYRGSLYGIPVTMNNLQVFCNRSILDRHGLAPPRTTDDLVRMGPALATAGRYPMAIGIADKWSGIDLFVVLARQLSGERDLVGLANHGEIGWDHPVFVEAMAAMARLARKGVFYPGATGMSFHGEAVRLWQEGWVAAIWPGTSVLACALPPAMRAEPVWFPVIPGGRPVLTGGVALCLVVSSQCPRPEPAVALLRWLTNAGAFETFARTGISPGGPVPAGIKSAYALADRLNAAQADVLDRRIYHPEVYEAISRAVQAVVDGAATSREACAMVQAAAGAPGDRPSRLIPESNEQGR